MIRGVVLGEDATADVRLEGGQRFGHRRPHDSFDDERASKRVKKAKTFVARADRACTRRRVTA